jgi:hypothetical protein
MGSVLQFKRKTKEGEDPLETLEARIIDAELSVANFFEKIIGDNTSKNEKIRLDRIRKNREVLKRYNMDSRKDRGK